MAEKTTIPPNADPNSPVQYPPLPPPPYDAPSAPPPAGFAPNVQQQAPPPQTTNVLIVQQEPKRRKGYCPACRNARMRSQFTFCGICWAICCFPCGLICCLLMTKKKCPNCGIHAS